MSSCRLLDPSAIIDRMTLNNTERTLQARAAAHLSWAHTADRTSRTAPARVRFLERFEREVDPDGVLSVDERARRAEHARKAYFASLALKSVQVRRARRAAREAR